MDIVIRITTKGRTRPLSARIRSWVAFRPFSLYASRGVRGEGWCSDMDLNVFSVSDIPLYAEALSAVLTGQSWVVSARWQTGIDVLPQWDDASRPDVVLVMCHPDLRPHWIRTVVHETGARVVAVGVSFAESDVLL